MTEQEIISLALKFREATDVAFKHDAFQEYPFNRFPRECCDDMCDLFGQLLLEKGISVYKVSGIYRYDNWAHKYPHAWLQLENGIIIDLTGDQYQDDPYMLNYNIPCFVGESDDLHNLFPKGELRIEPYLGIDNYPFNTTQNRLWKLYDTILFFYKSLNNPRSK